MNKLTGFVFFFLALQAYSLGQTEYWIHPHDTDPQISAWLDSHYVCINTDVVNQNLLYLFLPASYAKPKNTQLITQAAANNGYYSINLMYPNSWTVGSLCNFSEDSECFEKVRLEIIDGQDRTNKVNVNRSNSIENRLIKLLIYLNNNHPEQNWSQFLTASDEIIWSKIIVSGFSQGGGHAGVIAKYHLVGRVAFFASPKDYSDYFNAPAAWLYDTHMTPAEKYFGFNHFEDGPAEQLEIWSALRMPDSAHVINVDSCGYPYESSHQLITHEEPRVEGKYHACVVTDNATPLLIDGTPLFKDVWRYLFSVSDTAVSIISRESHYISDYQIRSYPNPFNSTTIIQFQIPEQSSVRLSIFDLRGRKITELMNEVVSAGKYHIKWKGRDDSGNIVSSGIYFSKVSIRSGTATRLFNKTNKLILIK